LTPILPEAMPQAPCAMQCINRIGPTFLWMPPFFIALKHRGINNRNRNFYSTISYYCCL
jgi:hypothetical protein